MRGEEDNGMKRSRSARVAVGRAAGARGDGSLGTLAGGVMNAASLDLIAYISLDRFFLKTSTEKSWQKKSSGR